MTAFNGEFHILHVTIMLFEDVGNANELVVDLFVGLLEMVDGFGSTDTCNDILTLSIHKIFAEELLLAGRRVTGESNAGAAVIAHIAEYHALYVNSGAPACGNIVHAAIDDSTGVVPAAEYCLNGFEELSHGILGEIKALDFFEHHLVCRNDLLEVLGGELGIQLAVIFLLDAVENLVKMGFFNFHNDIGEHLDEAAVAVVCKALVIGELCHSNYGLIIKAEVEDGIHHTGHTCSCAGANGYEIGIFRAAELLADLCFGNCKSCFDLLDDFIGDHFAVLIVTGAGFGAYGETVGNGETDTGHLGEVGALAAEELPHVRITLIKEVYILVRHHFPPFIYY